MYDDMFYLVMLGRGHNHDFVLKHSIDLFDVYLKYASHIKVQRASSNTHPFEILHSSVQTTLGSVEQLISTQNFMMTNGFLSVDGCFFDGPSVICSELCQILKGWVQI